MRTKLLFDDVDGSVTQVSEVVHIDQRVQWELIIDKIGTDGNPFIYLEQAFNGGGRIPEPTDWYIIGNKCDNTGAFLIDDTPFSIEKSSLKGNWFRIRLEPNDNTTGTVKALFGYKTFI